MSNRFDFEQQIFRCWYVTDDLDTLIEAVIEKDMSKDDIANTLLGIQRLYELRFSKLWDMFEDGVHRKDF